MLGDGRDEVAGLKDLEIAPDLGIEARAVDDRFPPWHWDAFYPARRGYG